MVITKEIENTWCPSNKKHFEQLGYKFTKMKDVFVVKFEDMPHNSDKFIDVKCDYCNKKIFPKQIKKYYRGRNVIEKDCCSDCRIEKSYEAKLKKYGKVNAYVNGYTVEKHKEKYRNDVGLKIFQQIKDIFKARDYILLSDTYINNHTPIEYICNKHSEYGKQSITWIHLRDGEGCYYCGLDKHRGENNNRWNGGISSLNSFLRNVIKPWVKDSLEKYNYKCDISGNGGYLEVHHVYKNFKDIVEETLSIIDLDIRKNIGEYSNEELELISKTCLDLHYKYGLGVCILKEYHMEFHNLYGVYNNTKEQYYAYKEYVLEDLKQCG